MPRETSHIIFATKFLSRSLRDDRILRACTTHRLDYYFGAMAPDLFYYCLEDAPVQHGVVSDYIHGAYGVANNLYIKSMLKDLQENPGQPGYDSKLAFICGVLTHVALDSTFHPLIYHVTGNYYAADPGQRYHAKVRHWLFETWLDLYNCKNHNYIKKWKTIKQISLNIQTKNWFLIDFYIKHINETWTFDFDLARSAREAFKIQTRFNQLAYSNLNVAIYNLYTKYFCKKDRHVLATLYPRKYQATCLLSNNCLIHPVSGEPMPNKIEAYWQQATDRHAEFLQDVTEYLSGEISQCDRIKNYSLETGMIETGTDRMKHFNILPFHLLLPRSMQGIFSEQSM